MNGRGYFPSCSCLEQKKDFNLSYNCNLECYVSFATLPLMYEIKNFVNKKYVTRAFLEKASTKSLL